MVSFFFIKLNLIQKQLQNIKKYNNVFIIPILINGSSAGLAPIHPKIKNIKKNK
jgi:hypothetical protein